MNRTGIIFIVFWISALILWSLLKKPIESDYNFPSENYEIVDSYGF